MSQKQPKKSTVSQAKYDADNAVRVTMKLNRGTDAAILTMLASVPSMSGYIRGLILEDIRKNHPEMLKVERFTKGEKMSLNHPTPKLHETLIRRKKISKEIEETT